MTNQNTNTITLPKSAIEEKQGVVILALRRWKEVEDSLEDLEMYHSESLVKEIDKRRKEKETIPLEKLLKKYHI